MTEIVSVRNLTKRYKHSTALDNVNFSLSKDVIYGLLGRNGAGKTTIMSILTAQNFSTSGDVKIFGEAPYENAKVLSRVCFVRESQRYPEDATPKQAFAMAKLFFENWDDDVAARLIDLFRLPMKRRIKKLSRGQLSAVGVIIGIASRAELTFFDEPYLGLDAFARQTFYDQLLADYAEHPRTIVLSSHLIDEISDLIERVILVDDGRIIANAETEELRQAALTLEGDVKIVDEFVRGREVLRRESLGRMARVSVMGSVSEEDRTLLSSQGVEVRPVSLQQLAVQLAQKDSSVKADKETAQ